VERSRDSLIVLSGGPETACISSAALWVSGVSSRGLGLLVRVYTDFTRVRVGRA